MIVFHHSKCHIVWTGISTHDAVIWSCQAFGGLMCGDSLTTVSLLKERYHTVVFKIIRDRTMRSPLQRGHDHFVHGGLARSDV